MIYGYTSMYISGSIMTIRFEELIVLDLFKPGILVLQCTIFLSDCFVVAHGKGVMSVGNVI